MAEKTIQASFRGVAFGLAESEAEFGRRGEHHEFPGRDRGYYEDFGLKDPGFSIEAFIGGRPDFEARRDALIRACNQPGPGELLHPDHGTRQVVCTGCRVRHSRDKRWLAVFQLSFLEAGSQPLPTATPDRNGRLRSTGLETRQQSLLDFGRRFSVRGQPDYVSAGLGDVLGRGLAMLQQAARQLGSGPDIGNGGLAAGFAHRLPNLRGLLFDTAALGQGLDAAFQQLGALAGTARQRQAAYAGLWQSGSDWPAVITGTPQRQVQAESQAALAALFRRQALIGAALALGEMDFDNHAEAVAYRDQTAAALEAEQQGTSDIALYGSLGQLRADLVRDVSARATDLSRIARITRPVTLPALRIAYDLYGDAGRADELVTRNRLRHGGFVPGGTALEVRVNGTEGLRYG